jgi:hypothetical protein
VVPEEDAARDDASDQYAGQFHGRCSITFDCCSELMMRCGR